MENHLFIEGKNIVKGRVAVHLQFEKGIKNELLLKNLILFFSTLEIKEDDIFILNLNNLNEYDFKLVKTNIKNEFIIDDKTFQRKSKEIEEKINLENIKIRTNYNKIIDTNVKSKMNISLCILDLLNSNFELLFNEHLELQIDINQIDKVLFHWSRIDLLKVKSYVLTLNDKVIIDLYKFHSHANKNKDIIIVKFLGEDKFKILNKKSIENIKKAGVK